MIQILRYHKITLDLYNYKKDLEEVKLEIPSQGLRNSPIRLKACQLPQSKVEMFWEKGFSQTNMG
jgi:hypothetical protein